MATKVALVTGIGPRRIGWYVADALANRGYALCVPYNRSAAEAIDAVAQWEKRGVQAMTCQVDLADENAVRTLLAKTLERFGRLDVLVTCAGMWHSKPLEEVTAADVRHNFEVNTLATFLCCQQAGLAMARQPEGGCIVTLGDWATARPYRDFAAYFASKGAIPALTRSLAVELGSRNPRIRVNCIEPGPVLFQPDFPDAERQRVLDATLVKRLGRPENVAQAVLFLVDNDFVTGICLPVDGGRMVFAPVD